MRTKKTKIPKIIEIRTYICYHKTRKGASYQTVLQTGREINVREINSPMNMTADGQARTKVCYLIDFISRR